MTRGVPHQHAASNVEDLPVVDRAHHRAGGEPHSRQAIHHLQQAGGIRRGRTGPDVLRIVDVHVGTLSAGVWQQAGGRAGMVGVRMREDDPLHVRGCLPNVASPLTMRLVAKRVPVSTSVTELSSSTNAKELM